MLFTLYGNNILHTIFRTSHGQCGEGSCLNSVGISFLLKVLMGLSISRVLLVYVCIYHVYTEDLIFGDTKATSHSQSRALVFTLTLRSFI